jgi:adenosine deaminase
MKEHPIRRFIKNNLRVTIGSDDPGIFDTTLVREYEHAANAGISKEDLENIKQKSKSYTSEKLTGRK